MRANNRTLLLCAVGVVSVNALLACAYEATDGAPKPAASSSGVPAATSVESFEQFVASRGHVLSKEERERVAAGDVPFALIDELLAKRDGIAQMPSGMLVTTDARQRQILAAARDTKTHDDMRASLALRGIDLTAPPTSWQTMSADGGTTSDAGGGTDSGSATDSGSTSDSGSVADSGSSNDAGQPTDSGTDASDAGDAGNCVIQCTIVASATYTSTLKGQNPVNTTRSDTTTPWPNSTVAHNKEVANWDTSGSSVGWTYIGWGTTHYNNDFYSPTSTPRTGNSDNSTREFGPDSVSEAVNLSFSCAPTAETQNACGNTWRATIAGITADAKASGALNATNNGTGDDEKLSIYTSAQPFAYLSIDRPPNACPPSTGWPSAKGSTTKPTIDFNMSSATTSQSEVGTTFDIKGDLTVAADGVKREATAGGKAEADGAIHIATLTKSGSTINGGTSTITAQEHANVPASYTFLPDCTTESVLFKAGFDTFTSTENKGASDNGSFTSLLDVGAIHSTWTATAFANTGSLLKSCTAAVPCTVK